VATLRRRLRAGLRIPSTAILTIAAGLILGAPAPAEAQEARKRWERMCTIRAEKFDHVLPGAMRDNDIDMWITVMREGGLDPLWEALGRGYVGDWAYYVFTDRGDERIERAALGVSGGMIEGCGVYDLFLGADALASFVRERDPARIGVNMAESIGNADGLSLTGYNRLRETLGEPYADRLVSAEKLVSDFRSIRTTVELGAFAEAAEISREIAERALSNEVITPGATRLEDVAWWMWDRLLERGLDSSFDMPSVYVTGPEGIVAVSNDRVIQRGDLMMIDWGVGFLDLYTDMKRVAYVLREGETEVPASLRHAYQQGVAARDVMVRAIRPAPTALHALRAAASALEEAGYRVVPFNSPSPDPDVTDIVMGPHSVGNLGHGVGPSLAFFNPTRQRYELRSGTIISVELFAYTAVPEWDNAKVRIPLEDNALITERGAEWFAPPGVRILTVW
jgi:Xaa-Pro aminopeptidase